MIEILLVGVGGYGVNYVRELLGPDAPEGVRVAGIADPVARRSDCWEMIEDAGIPVYDTIEEIGRASCRERV